MTTTVFVHALTGKNGLSNMLEHYCPHGVCHGLSLLFAVEPSDNLCAPFPGSLAKSDVSIAGHAAPVGIVYVESVEGFAYVSQVRPSVVATIFSSVAALTADMVNHFLRPFAGHPKPCNAVRQIALPVNSNSSVSVWTLSARKGASRGSATWTFPAECAGLRIIVQEFAHAICSKHVFHLDSSGRAPVRHRYRTMSGLQSHFPAPETKIP